MILPEIGPRLVGLFGSGFGYLTFLVASVYGMVRLLPPGHPYLNPQNIGRFSLKNVIGQAADNLRFSRKNIDQIVIFFMILLAIGLLVLQFVLLIYFLFMGHARADISSEFTGSLFNTPKPEKDLALNLLDRVFGIPGMFCNVSDGGGRGTCTEVSAAHGGIPWPIHNALHDLFYFYSYAILLVGVIIFLYFVVVVVMETASTGSPFGQRFQNIWVPIRLVMALGLLVPINYGMNTGQYITLYAAKMGSAVATNGWLRFNSILSSGMGDAVNPTGEDKASLVALPQTQSVAGVVQSMVLVHACAYGQWLSSPNRPSAYPNSSDIYTNRFTLVKPYLVKNAENWMGDSRTMIPLAAGTQHTDALDFYANGDIIIRFGEHNPDAYPTEIGNVKSVCGDIRIPVVDVSHKGEYGTVGGSDYVLRTFFNMVRDMWFSDQNMKDGAARYGELMMPSYSGTQVRACSAGCGNANLPACGGGVRPACYVTLPGAQWKQSLNDFYQIVFDTAVKQAWGLYVKYTEDVRISQEILDLGWGGSAVWYNTISNVNGNFLTSTINMPFMHRYPDIMERVRKLRAQFDSEVIGLTQFSPHLSLDNTKTGIGDHVDGRDAQMATLMDAVYQAWNEDGGDQSNPEKTVMYNAFRDAMGMILGLDGLIDMRGANAHVHPLAQLTMIGKGMVESTIRNLAISSFTAFMGGFLGSSKAPGAGLMNAISGFFFSTAFLGLTAGVTLYYVVPFLPFIYFFFAVGSWVKSIFEAMVGVPLWALAHLRLDGEGLPGTSAENGYYLILEIGIRPILTVFGLISALLIFTAEVRILNFVWQLVTYNAAGFTQGSVDLGTITADNFKDSFKRETVDQFFYTSIYAIIVYMMAMSAFKMIDLVPNQIMRWLGSSASSFADDDPKVAEQLNSYFARAGMIHGQTITGGVKDLAGGVGAAGGQGLSGLGRLMTGGRRGPPPTPEG